jgi:hypothetical protein
MFIKKENEHFIKFLFDTNTYAYEYEDMITELNTLLNTN